MNDSNGNLSRLLGRVRGRLVGHVGASQAVDIPSLGLVGSLLAGGALAL